MWHTARSTWRATRPRESKTPIVIYICKTLFVLERATDHQLNQDRLADSVNADGFPDLIVAAIGPSKIHQRIALAIGADLRAHLRGERCDVYLDTRAWVGKRDRVPDITVTCSEHDLNNADDVVCAPKLLIEVLSKNRGGDLDEKIDEYASLFSIEEYVVVDSRRRWLRRY